VIRSGSSSNTPLGVTTTTTETTSQPKTNQDRTTTPFCLGCGDWIEDIDEMNVLPFFYCEWCAPKRVARVTHKKKVRREPM
jgi:hypothetical protein